VRATRVGLRDGEALAVRSGGAGAPLLLVHGFTGSAAAWGEDLLAALAGRFRVIAVDLLGHGASSRPRAPARYALAEQVSDLCEVLDACGAGEALWVGYSMGGRIALAAACERPGRVRGLVLEGASPGLAQPEERAARIASDAALAQRLERLGIEAFVEGWMAQPLFATQRRLGPERLLAERERRLRGDPLALAACLRGAGTGAQVPLWERLHAVDVPVLLVAGEEDAKFRALGGAMARALPRAEEQSIPAAGHATHLENPEAFTEALCRFARQVFEEER
jgi:2-succinyl-6-hydroxy-2,4-cyclohexadiene-1-carboxylate synthase